MSALPLKANVVSVTKLLLEGDGDA